MNPCLYHPEAEARTMCVVCGTPICGNCSYAVGPKIACGRCADGLLARMQGQQASGSGASNMAAGPQTAVPASAIPYQRPFEAGQAVVTDDDDKIPAGRLAAGLTLGLVAGVIMSLIVMKIAFYAHLNLSLLYVGIGYGVGFAIYKVTGQGGAGLAFGGSALMALGLLIGHLVYASDVLGAYRQELGLSDSATIFSAFGPLMATLSLRHWMCVAIGLGACFRAIEAQDGKG